jgi:hypothetical protein
MAARKAAPRLELPVKLVTKATLTKAPPSTVSAERSWTVLGLKQAIADWAGPPVLQALVFEGRVLEDDGATLGAAGLHERATLVVATRSDARARSVAIGGARVFGWSPPAPGSQGRAAVGQVARLAAKLLGCCVLALCLWHNVPQLAASVGREQIGGLLLMAGLVAFVRQQLQRARDRKAAAATAAAAAADRPRQQHKDAPEYPDDVSAMMMGCAGGG